MISIPDLRQKAGATRGEVFCVTFENRNSKKSSAVFLQNFTKQEEELPDLKKTS